MQLKNLKEKFRHKYAMRFEPVEPILNAGDFKRELIKYCDEEKKELIILKESMTPIVKIDGEKYWAELESPTMLPFIYIAHFGFKWVYLYPYIEAED